MNAFEPRRPRIPGDGILCVLEAQRETVIVALMRGLDIRKEDAVDLLYTTLAELFIRYRQCQWPKEVECWGAYLVTCCNHAYYRRPTRDGRLLFFCSPLAEGDERSPLLDARSTDLAPGFQAEREEIIERVRAAIKRLTIPQQMAVLLASAGYRSRDIGRTLNISTSYARVLTHNALQALRIELRDIA
jgi:DNA-directed RNA polymerase specialized sigma24 family protein